MTTDHQPARQGAGIDESRRPHQALFWPALAGVVTFFAAGAALAPYPDLLSAEMRSARQLAWYAEAIRGILPVLAAATAFVIIQRWRERAAARRAG
jgi:hypothetical protein